MPSAELRPLSIGELLDRTFSLYRRHFLLFVGIAAIPALVHFVYAVSLVLVALVPGGPGSAAVLAIGIILVFILVFAFTYGLAIAATVFAVSEVNLGRPVTITQSLARARPLALRAFWIVFLLGIAVGVGLILLIVPGVFVAVTYAVSLPAAVIENLKANPSFRRSEFLTKGRRWGILLVFLLYVVISYVAAFTLGLPFGILQALRPGVATVVLTNLAGLVSEALTGPFLTISLSLVYYDLRVRKEGFDLQVMLTALGDSAPSANPPQAVDPA